MIRTRVRRKGTATLIFKIFFIILSCPVPDLDSRIAGLLLSYERRADRTNVVVNTLVDQLLLTQSASQEDEDRNAAGLQVPYSYRVPVCSVALKHVKYESSVKIVDLNSMGDYFFLLLLMEPEPCFWSVSDSGSCPKQGWLRRGSATLPMCKQTYF